MEHFYQWDINRKLLINDKSVNEVHFANSYSTNALVCAVYEKDGKRVVNVPNILLQEHYQINAYLYDNERYTKQLIPIEVIKRKKPDDYVYTETEIKRWEDLEQRVIDGIGYYKPSVDTDGNLSWTANNPSFSPVETVNIKGEAGEAGVVDYSLVSNALIRDISGSTIAFDDVSPLNNNLQVKSRIDAIQSGSGDASPDNVRPIVGWNAVNTVRCCKNLNKINGSILTADAKELTLIDFGKDVYFDNLTFSCFMENAVCQSMSSVFICYKSDGKFTTISASSFGVSGVNTAQNGRKTYTLNGLTVRKINSLFMPNGYGKWSGVIKDCQIELGSTATPYEPYTSDTYTAELPETIYGGELDWNTGVLTVDRAIDVKTSGDIRESASGTQFVTPAKYDCAIAYYSPCNCMNGFFHAGAFYRANKSDTGYETLTELQEALGDTPIQLCYKLETPYTVQLTPQQITALAGTNTIYTDSGDTVVVYNRDINAAFEELRQAIISLGGNV